MSSLQSRTTLPQELVDHIIDHCHDDIHLLQSLALVSKSWLFPARHHIFYTISVTPDTMQQSGLSSVVELLKAGPSVYLSVREFIVGCGRFSLSTLVSIICELPNLRLLPPDDTMICDSTLPTPPPAQLFRGIETLRVVQTELSAGGSALHALIGLFRSITELTVEMLWSGVTTNPVPSESPSPSSRERRKTRIDSLIYHGNIDEQHRPFSPLTEGIVKLLDDASLSALTVGLQHWYPPSSGQVRLLISAAAWNLRYLEIHFGILPRGVSGETLQVDLSSCTILESIHFCINFHDAIAWEHWVDAHTTLSTLPRLSIVSDITFIITTRVKVSGTQAGAILFDTSGPPWRDLQRMLARFASLRTLRFKLLYVHQAGRSTLWPESMVESIRSRLRELGLEGRYQLEVLVSKAPPGHLG